MVGLLLVVVLSVARWWLGARADAALPNPALYQLITTTNGQLYYGKLANINTKWPILRDVFYLKERPQELQAGRGGGKGGSSSNGPKFNLTKLGAEEIHGTEDTLYLNRDQIVYWVNLVPNSQVVKTINQYKAQPR